MKKVEWTWAEIVKRHPELRNKRLLLIARAAAYNQGYKDALADEREAGRLKE